MKQKLTIEFIHRVFLDKNLVDATFCLDDSLFFDTRQDTEEECYEDFLNSMFDIEITRGYVIE